MDARANLTQPAEPLNPQQKSELVAKLKTIQPDVLNEALIAAALPPNLCQFPEPLKQDIIDLQNAYEKYRSIPQVANSLVTALKDAMILHGCKLFQDILTKPFNEAEWNSDFLHTLAKQLNININATPKVQVTIQNGKVFWRIMCGDVIVHNRPEIKGWTVQFTQENSWLMSWEMFRTFKDSGKRYSPLTVNKNDFVNQFNAAFRTIAGNIWEELRTLNIITHKNKLSRGWCVLQNDYIKLQAIELVRAKTEKDTKKIKMQLYSNTMSTIYKLLNDNTQAERFECIPGASIFRYERTLKIWEGTGRVKNLTSTEEFCCSKLWDVSPYIDLDAHRNTKFEKEKYKVKLNYDHIPAASTLENGNNPIAVQINGWKKVRQMEIDQMMALGYPLTHETRNAMQTITAEQKLMHDKANTLISEFNKVSAGFRHETHQLGYTVAIPEKLHHGGDTFAQSATDQQQRQGHLFLDDIEAHINNIKKDPAAFSLVMDDLIKALGAFRTLYRNACKPLPLPLPGTLQVGRIAQFFFAQATDRDRADKMFRHEIKDFLAKRESKTTGPNIKLQ